MSEKEINKLVAKKVIGVLLSLVALIVIVLYVLFIKEESTLKETDATVISCKKVGDAQYEVDVVYKVEDGNSYLYSYDSSKKESLDSKVKVYYDVDNVTSVKTIKSTSTFLIIIGVAFIIFIIGILLFRSKGKKSLVNKNVKEVEVLFPDDKPKNRKFFN